MEGRRGVRESEWVLIVNKSFILMRVSLTQWCGRIPSSLLGCLLPVFFFYERRQCGRLSGYKIGQNTKASKNKSDNLILTIRPIFLTILTPALYLMIPSN